MIMGKDWELSANHRETMADLIITGSPFNLEKKPKMKQAENIWPRILGTMLDARLLQDSTLR